MYGALCLARHGTTPRYCLRHLHTNGRSTVAHRLRQRLRLTRPGADSYSRSEAAAVRPVPKRYSHPLHARKAGGGCSGLPRSAATPRCRRPSNPGRTPWWA